MTGGARCRDLVRLCPVSWAWLHKVGWADRLCLQLISWGVGVSGARCRLAAVPRMTPPGPRRVAGRAASFAYCAVIVVKRRSRRLLATTKTEENAIAAPAIIGLSRPAAARGTAATL